MDSKTIKKLTGYSAENIEVYNQALRHKSASTRDSPSNERLEFIGDAVVGLAIADYLYCKFPASNEGILTRARSKIVGGKGLAKLARHLQLDRFIAMDTKAMRNGWNTNLKVLENAFEALVGALYLDKGFPTAKKFICKVVNAVFDVNDLLTDENYKDVLTRFAADKKLGVVGYSTLSDNPFTVRISLNNCVIAHGHGSSKKEAEQMAAQLCLVTLGAEHI